MECHYRKEKVKPLLRIESAKEGSLGKRRFSELCALQAITCVYAFLHIFRLLVCVWGSYFGVGLSSCDHVFYGRSLHIFLVFVTLFSVVLFIARSLISAWSRHVILS